MDELIQQAFVHVDVIGPHVRNGRYDLVGPNGEIILKQVWETVIQPDWAITMHMWPMPEPKGPPVGMFPPGHPMNERPRSGGHRHSRGAIPVPPSHHRGGGGPGPGPGPGPSQGRTMGGGMGGPMAPPPPPNWAGGGPPRPGQPPIVVMGGDGGRHSRSPQRKKKGEPSKGGGGGMLGWMAGASKPAKPSGKGVATFFQWALT